MATSFDVRARLIADGPYNLQPTVRAFQNKIANIPATINPKLSPDASRGVASLAGKFDALNSVMKSAAGHARDVSRAARGVDFSGINPRNIEATNKLISATVRSLNKVRGELGGATSQAEALGQTLGNTARRFGAFVLIVKAFEGVRNAFSQGVSQAAQFQHEMVRLGQVGATSAKEVGDIGREITRLSTGLGTSSRDLSQLSTTLRQAGLDAVEVKTALSALAKTTLAPTFESIQNTTEGVIALRQQFGVTAKDFESHLGSINTVSAAFAVESNDLVTAIRKTGGAFSAASGGSKNAEQSFRELISLFTSVRSTTRESADEIATGFRTIFGRLQTKPVSDALRNMGIELRHTKGEVDEFGRSLEGQFVGGYEAINRLSAATKNLSTTDPRFSNIIQQIGGYRQISRVIPLLQQFNVAQRAYGIAQTGSNSLTQDASRAQDSYIVRLTKVREAFFDLIRTVGDNKEFKSFLDLMIKSAEVAVTVAKNFEPLIPLIASITAVKAVSGAFQFAKGFRDTFTTIPEAKRPGYASGGVVHGSGNRDTVPATLPQGSYVVKKSSAKKIGYERLARMGYASGGSVDVMLTPGEYVFDDKQASRIGKHALDHMNARGQAPADPRDRLAAKLKKLAAMRNVGVGDVMKPAYADGGVATNDQKLLDSLRSQLAGIGLGGIDLSKVLKSVNFVDKIGDEKTAAQGFQNIGGAFNTKTGSVTLNRNNPDKLLANFAHELFHAIDFAEARRTNLKTKFASHAPGNVFSRSAELSYQAALKGGDAGVSVYNPYIKKHGETGYDHEKLAFGVSRYVREASSPRNDPDDAEHLTHFSNEVVGHVLKHYGQETPSPVKTRLSGFVSAIQDQLPRANKQNRKTFSLEKLDLAVAAKRLSTTDFLSAAGIKKHYGRIAGPEDLALLQKYVERLGVPVDLGQAFSLATGRAGSAQKKVDLSSLEGGVAGYAKSLFGDATSKTEIAEIQKRFSGRGNDPGLLSQIGLSRQEKAAQLRKIRHIAASRIKELGPKNVKEGGGTVGHKGFVDSKGNDVVAVDPSRYHDVEDVAGISEGDKRHKDVANYRSDLTNRDFGEINKQDHGGAAFNADTDKPVRTSPVSAGISRARRTSASAQNPVDVTSLKPVSHPVVVPKTRPSASRDYYDKVVGVPPVDLDPFESAYPIPQGVSSPTDKVGKNRKARTKKSTGGAGEAPGGNFGRVVDLLQKLIKVVEAGNEKVAKAGKVAKAKTEKVAKTEKATNPTQPARGQRTFEFAQEYPSPRQHPPEGPFPGPARGQRTFDGPNGPRIPLEPIGPSGKRHRVSTGVPFAPPDLSNPRAELADQEADAPWIKYHDLDKGLLFAPDPEHTYMPGHYLDNGEYTDKRYVVPNNPRFPLKPRRFTHAPTDHTLPPEGVIPIPLEGSYLRRGYTPPKAGSVDLSGVVGNNTSSTWQEGGSHSGPIDLLSLAIGDHHLKTTRQDKPRGDTHTDEGSFFPESVFTRLYGSHQVRLPRVGPGSYKVAGEPPKTPEKPEIRRSLFLERWLDRKRVAGNNLFSLPDDERRNVLDQAQAMYGGSNPGLYEAVRAGKADVHLTSTGGLLRARERTGTRESRLSNIGRFLSAPVTLPKPSLGNGRLGGFAKASGNFASSYGFAIAASYAPSVAEHFYGSVEKPKGSRQAAAYASAGGTALQYGAIGAQLGIATGNPLVAAGAGVAGALIGFVSQLNSANEEIAKINFSESLKKLDGVIDGVANGLLDLKPNLGKVHEGISLRSAEAGRLAGNESGTFLDRHLLDQSSIGSKVAHYGFGVSGSIARSVLGYDAEGKYRQEATLRQEKSAELIGPQLPQLQQIAERIAADVKVDDTSPGGRQARQDAFNNAGGRQLAETISYVSKVPLSQVIEQYDKMIVTTNKARLSQEKFAEASNDAAVDVAKFSRLSQAVEAASASVLKLGDTSDSISSLFDGQVHTGKSVGFAEAAAQGGGLDAKAFQGSLDFVKSGLGGGRLADSFVGNAREIDRLKQNLASQITESVGRGGFNEETISGDVGSAISDKGYSPHTVSRINAAVEGIDPKELQRRVAENPQKLAEDLISHAFGDVEKLPEQIARQLQDFFGRNAESLNRGAAIQNTHGETLDRVSGAGLRLNRAQANLKSVQTGLNSDRFLSLEDLREPFVARQRRLAGPSVANPLDSESIVRRFHAVRSDIEKERSVINNEGTSNDDRLAAQQRFTGLTSEASKLQEALRHLSDTSEEASAIQEKLAATERERSGQLGFAERVATAGPKELREIARNANLSDIAVSQGHFANFDAGSRSRVLDHLRSLQDVKLPGYGNRTGGEVAEGLLDNVRGRLFGNANANDRLNAANGLVGVEKRGREATQGLASVQEALNTDYFNNLKSVNQNFLSQMKALLDQSLRKDLAAEVDKASVTRSKVGSQAEAAREINGAFDVGGGGTGLAKARAVLSSPELSSLESALGRQDALGAHKTAPDDISRVFARANGGAASLFGRNVPSVIKPGDDETFKKNLAALHGNLTSASEELGRNSGLSGDEVRKNLIPKVLAGLDEAQANSRDFNVGQAISSATRSVRTSSLGQSLEDARLSRGDIGRRYYGVDSVGGDLEDRINGHARNAGRLRQRLSDAGNAGTLAEAEKSLAEADNALAALRRRQTDGVEVAHKAAGGSIFKPRGTDTVPAMLSPGEFIVNAKSAAVNRPLLDAINSGKGAAYKADGGDLQADARTWLSNRQIIDSNAAYAGRLAGDGTSKTPATTASTGPDSSKLIAESTAIRTKETAAEAFLRAASPAPPARRTVKQVVSDYDQDARNRQTRNLINTGVYASDFTADGPVNFGPDWGRNFVEPKRARKGRQAVLRQQPSEFVGPPAPINYRAIQRGKKFRAVQQEKIRRAQQRSRGEVPLVGITRGPLTPAWAFGRNNRLNQLGTDTVPAMLTPGEFVINKNSARGNRPLLDQINRNPLYRANGGPVGNVPAASGGSQGVPVSQIAQLTKALQGFQAPVKALESVGQALSTFSTSAAKLSEGLKPFTDAAMSLSKSLASVSIPSVINVQTNSRVEVLINGAAMITAIKGDLSKEITNEVLAKLTAELPRMVAEMPVR